MSALNSFFQTISSRILSYMGSIQPQKSISVDFCGKGYIYGKKVIVEKMKKFYTL